MPNPHGPLSRAMPSPAITAANKEIRQLTAKGSKRGHYHRYSIQLLTQENHTALLAAISTRVYFHVVKVTVTRLAY